MTDALDQSLLIPVKIPDSTSKPRGRPRADGLPPGSPEAKAADAAKGKSTGAPRGRKASSKISDADLKIKLVEMYAMVGMAVMARPKYTSTAMSIVQNAEKCADAWITLAKENKAVRLVLERLVTVSTFGTLVMVHMPIALAAASDSGMVSGDLAESLKVVANASSNGGT